MNESRFGEGTGVPMQACVDPNKPSYDPATCSDQTTKKLIWLCAEAWERMNEWERKFVQEVYGQSPMSRRMHVKVHKIHRKYSTP